MVEKSVACFLGRATNSVNRFLYELTATATGSYKSSPHNSPGLLLKHYNGIKSWWCMLELPCVRGEYHGQLLQHLIIPRGNDCKIELFGDIFGAPLEHASPYVLISGTKQKDVKIAASIVSDAMRNHQLQCGCKPSSLSPLYSPPLEDMIINYTHITSVADSSQ